MTPPLIDIDALRRATADLPRWRSIDVVAQTGSTNVDLADGLRRGDLPGAVLLAEVQTAGRGRHQRPWSAPPGTQLAMSVTVDVPTITSAGWLPLLTGLAAADAIAAVAYGDPATSKVALKWPNDILSGTGKLAGILAELVHTPARTAAVIGLGLNASLGQAELPVPTATSLALTGALTTDRTVLAAAFLRQLDAHLTTFERHPDQIRAAYRRRCATVGKRVRVELPDATTLVGLASDIDDDGRVVVTTTAGSQALSAGDVTHLRAT